MTSISVHMTLAAVGNCGKTTIARHVLATVTGGALSTLACTMHEGTDVHGHARRFGGVGA